MSYDVMATFKLRDQMTDKIRNIGRGADQANRQLSSLSRATSGLGSSFGKTAMSIVTGGAAIVGAIGGIAAAYGAVKIASSALKLSSDAEQANIAFTTMLGSADKAASFLKDLTNFANKTPFELPGVRDSAKKLLAFGFTAESILPMLTGVGNAAAGLGLGADGIDRISLALGQMKAKAKVSGDEMMQLTEAGIPAWQILADKMKITTAQVMKMSEKGLIPADKAIQALIEGMNKRFPDMMEKQSKSLAGLWSTMKDVFNNNILKKFGDGIAATLKPRFDAIATWIDNNGATITRWGETIKRVTAAAADAIAKKFDSAFKYVKTHYLDNPAFTSIPDVSGQVTFIIDDLMNTYTKWYEAGGKDKIHQATESITNSISTMLADTAAKLMVPALDLGTNIAAGITKGLAEALANHPLGSAVMGALMGSRFGPLGAVAGAGAGVIGSQIANSYVERLNRDNFYSNGGVPGWIDRSKNGNMPKSTTPNNVIPMNPTGGITLPGSAMDRFKPRSSNAGGLDRVPYNGYVLTAHKDEKVLTASEAESYRSNRGSMAHSGPLFTVQTMNVRQESDIDAIALALAKQMRMAQEAGAYAG